MEKFSDIIKTYCSHCDIAGHFYPTCTKRIKWLVTYQFHSELERLLNIGRYIYVLYREILFLLVNHRFFPTIFKGVSDHNAVTLSQFCAAFLDFNAYVSEAVAIYALQFGGIAIVPSSERQGSFGENDRFSKVTVTHLRQEYRSCGEGVFETSCANLPEISYQEFYGQCITASATTADNAYYGLGNPFWSAILKSLRAIPSNGECKLYPLYVECLAASLLPCAGNTW